MRRRDRVPLSRTIAAVWFLAIAFVHDGHASRGPGPDFLERYSQTYRFRLGAPSAIRPTPDGRAVLFLRSGPRSFVRDLYEIDVLTGRERVLLTADSILQGRKEQLSDEERARRERKRVSARGIVSYELSGDGTRVLTSLSGRLYLLERRTGARRELPGNEAAAIDARFSPDGTRVACVRNGDLHVIDIATGRERRLTLTAGEGLTNGLAEFVAQEEMSRHHGYWWSPDSRWIVYQQTDGSNVDRLSFTDLTRPERPPKQSAYPKAGRPNASVRLGILSVDGGPTTWVQWDREDYEYLATVKWTENSPLTIVVQNRRQTESLLLEVDPTDGSTRTLLVERDEDWVEIDQQVPLWLPDGSGFLWTTERRGGLQVELRRRDGTLARTVTSPDLGMQALVHYLPGTAEVVVKASVDPTRTHLFRVPIAGGDVEPRKMTSGAGVHSAVFNESGTTWVHEISTIDGRRRQEIVGSSGPTGFPIHSVAESPGFTPNLELTTVGRDPELHAALVRPTDFDPAKRYPVIVHVYGGPTGQMVRAQGSRYLLDQWIADHGYVVVRIDGRGTPGRGRAWQRVVKGDLIEIPLADQATGLRGLGAKYRELDLSRVGIYGWSFGGYFSAMAVMREGGLFRAGVAGAPVVDWRDYDTHYTERYMGLPGENAAGYEAANVLTHAPRLARPLLVIHGTVDDNVHFTHSLKLVDALFRAGRSFEFLPLSGLTHMVPDPDVTFRLYSRIMEFMDRHVKDVGPRFAPPLHEGTEDP